MWSLQFPFAVHFLLCDPLWSYGMKSGFAEKQFFKLRFFFAHACTASNPWSRALQQLWQVARCDCERQSTGNQENDSGSSYWMPKESPAKIRTSNLQAWSLAPWQLCNRNLAFKEFCLLILSLCLGCKGLGLAWVAAAKNHFFTIWLFFLCAALMKLREAGLCKKTIFQALKKNPRYSFETRLCKQKHFSGSKTCFLHTAHTKLREAWLCIKTIFQALENCFSTLLSWNSDKPGFAKNNFWGSIFFFACLLSNFKLAPNCADACDTYITKNALRIWGM